MLNKHASDPSDRSWELHCQLERLRLSVGKQVAVIAQPLLLRP